MNQNGNKAELAAVRQRYGHLELYRVWPEWSSSGVWLPPNIGTMAVGPNLIIEDFPISSQLKERLARWQGIFDDQIPEKMWPFPGPHAAFSAEGLNIAVELSRELGSEVAVEYELGIDGAVVMFQAGTCVAAYQIEEPERPTT